MSKTTVAAGLFLSFLSAAADARGPAASAQKGAARKKPPASECAAEKPGGGRRYKAVKDEPRLGQRVSPDPRRHLDLLMTASGGLQPSYDVSHGGIHYTVATDNDETVIEYVSTRDPAFRTPEGLAAGDTLGRVLAVSKSEVRRERGWAFHVALPSGWSAAFVQGESMTDGELPPTARVCFFFKRGR